MILFIGAHADDTVLGCGGVTRKFLADGEDVTILILTTGDYRDKTLTTERTNILADIYPEANMHFFDYNDQELDTYPQADIANDISSIIKLEEPELIFTHCKDLNLDHKLTYHATKVATRRLPVKLCTYMIPGNESKFFPTYYEDIYSFMNRKLEDFRKFRDIYPTPEQIIACSNTYSNIIDPDSCKHYEAFEVLRWI